MALLDPYREILEAWKVEGVSQADMRRRLKEHYGEEVKPQTLSDYMKKLDAPGQGDGNGAALAPAVLPRQADMEIALLGASMVEVVNRLAQVIEGLQQVKREGEARHTEIVATLKGLRFQDVIDRHTLPFQALYKQFKGEVMLRIWLKALVVSGASWGVVWLALRYGWRVMAMFS